MLNRTEQNRTEQNRTEQNRTIVRHAEASTVAIPVIANDSEAICSVKEKHKGEFFGVNNLFKRLLRNAKLPQVLSPMTRSDVKGTKIFSLFTSNLLPSFGFSLAEVLITLGIIGVVAAISIPNLIANYQKTQTVVQLKKAYTLLCSAAKMSEMESGPMPSWDPPSINFETTESIIWWNKYFIPYMSLSVIKDCTAGTMQNCWSGSAKYLDGTNMLPPTLGQVLKDGSSIGYVTVDNNNGQLYVDVNGIKKPNIVGKDIFYLLVAYKSGKIIFFGSGSTRAYLLEDHNATCNKATGAYKGVGCGTLIQKDGWQIADDYPWN